MKDQRDMKYKMRTPFAGFDTDFIYMAVHQMRRYEIHYGEIDRLLNNDEEMDVYMMQIGCMPSEIGVS